MSVLKKLMEARIKLQNTELKKSGHNKFAGYSYFELGDFLPAVQNIFNDVGLCGVVSFGIDKAVLTITDTETDKSISIETPMSEANLKGCHAVQNLGAVQTYLRRYLWVTALEIVEHDALDGAKPIEKELLTKEQQDHINRLLKEVNITDATAFCNVYGVKTVDQISIVDFANAISMLDRKKKAVEKKRLQEEDVPQ